MQASFSLQPTSELPHYTNKSPKLCIFSNSNFLVKPLQTNPKSFLAAVPEILHLDLFQRIYPLLSNLVILNHFQTLSNSHILHQLEAPNISILQIPANYRIHEAYFSTQSQLKNQSIKSSISKTIISIQF